jgi:hypothetical protein
MFINVLSHFSVLIFASWRPCAFAFWFFICIFSGSLPPIRRTNISGGIRRAIRCIGVISVALAGLPADPKCRFGGFSLLAAVQFGGKYAICATTVTATKESSLKACPVLLLRYLSLSHG